MEGFRFILENPHPNASNKQRKRARLVTACDSCRVKKIKCQQSSPNGRCEACKTAKTPCLFGDRDRYQAERGVTCTWSSPVDNSQQPSDASTRKRKSAPSATSSPTSQWTVLPSHPYPSTPHSYYEQPQQHAGPSYSSQYNSFPVQPVASLEAIPLFDPHRPRCPHPHRMSSLANLFFDTIGDHCHFLDRVDVIHRIEHRTCSDILSNTIAALALRYADPIHPDAFAGAPYLDMAKALASQVGSAPSIEALHALLCISFAEYAAGNDDGFLQYSRMAITMSVDLGLGHEATIRVATVPETRERLRITWWTVVCYQDIAASWLASRPTLLDLTQYDTELPAANDEPTTAWRFSVQLLLFKAKINRHLDTCKDETKLEWKLRELRVELVTLMQGAPTFMAFNEHNLLHSQDHRYGHVFVLAHLVYHAMTVFLNRPSFLSSANFSPLLSDGSRTDAARSSAKALVDVLSVVQKLVPQTLCDPVMDLPILTAARLLVGETEITSSSVSQRWSETWLTTCKSALVKLSASCGRKSVSFDNVLNLHGAFSSEESQLPSPASSFDAFSTPSSTLHWLLKPSLVEDNESDSASSFRSSSREVSPLLSATPANVPDYVSSTPSLVNTPAIPSLDVPVLGYGSREFTLEPLDLFSTTASLDSDIFELPGNYLDRSTLHLSLEETEAHRILSTDVYSGKPSPSVSLFSPLPWISRS